MVKITLQIEGMACGMCEAHINNAIRSAFKIKKVDSSHSKGITHIISEQAIDENKLKLVIDQTGYRLLNIKTEPYIKKGFGIFGK